MLDLGNEKIKFKENEWVYFNITFRSGDTNINVITSLEKI